MQQIGYNASSYSGQTPYYEPHGSSYPVPPPSAPYNYLAPSAQPSPVPTPYSPRWSQSQGEQPAASYGGQWTASSTQGHTSNLRSGSYPPPQGQQWPSQPPSYTETPDTNGPTFQQRPLSPAYGYGSPSEEPTTPTTDVVPPPRRRVSPGSKDSSNGRSGSNRPTGVLKCSSCKATQSPEWRKGPSGKKELCNAYVLSFCSSVESVSNTLAAVVYVMLVPAQRRKELPTKLSENGKIKELLPLLLLPSAARRRLPPRR
jgi:hypothetical protein